MRIIPNNYEKYDTDHIVKDDLNDLEIFADISKMVACCHTPKTKKPFWHYRFKDLKQMDDTIKRAIESRISQKQSVIERRKERSQGHDYQVGDFIYCSWGYDQTNVDFFKVVSLKGKQTIEIVKVQKEYVEQNGAYGNKVQPTRIEKGQPMTKRVGKNNHIALYGFTYGSKWDNVPKYETDKLFGH